MSHERARWREVVETYWCPACNVAPGIPCVTKAGHPMREPHAPRSRRAEFAHWHRNTEQPAVSTMCHNPECLE